MLDTLISLALVAVIQAAAGQAQPPAAPPPQAALQATSTYQVGPADVLGIRVFGEDQYNGKYTVDADGSITFPLIGRTVVGGRTTRVIEQDLIKLLEAGFLKRAQVSVEIATFRSRSIYVLGEVRTPGRYTIEGPMTLLEVIAQAGSTTASASNTIVVQRYKEGLAAAVAAAPANVNDTRWAEVTRINLDDLREGRLASNLLLQDSDMIIVPTAERVYVSGFVKQPGSFVLRTGMTVRQAITEAGGFSERGSTRGIKIIRKGKDGKEVEVNANMSDLVRPNDTIRVRQRLI